MTTRTPLTGPSVWRGQDIKDSRRWIRDLPPEALDELDAAVKSVRGMPWQEITREDFALPMISDLLDDVADELENGCGMVKLRGIPVDGYSEDELRQMYFGLGTHIGTPVFQNRSGELMRAIRDEGAHVGRTYGETKDEKGSTFLSSYARTLTNGGLRFHTDRTDVVGLLCVRQARAGGVSKLASTPAIHNAILAKRPDLLESCSRTTGAAASARKAPRRTAKRRPRRPPTRCRSSACATASSPRTIRSPSSRRPKWRPMCPSSPTPSARRSIS